MHIVWHFSYSIFCIGKTFYICTLEVIAFSKCNIFLIMSWICAVKCLKNMQYCSININCIEFVKHSLHEVVCLNKPLQTSYCYELYTYWYHELLIECVMIITIIMYWYAQTIFCRLEIHWHNEGNADVIYFFHSHNIMLPHFYVWQGL